MRAMRSFRTLVVAATVAFFGVGNLCPGGCILAAASERSEDCHDEGEQPASHPDIGAVCCPSVIARKSSAQPDEGHTSHLTASTLPVRQWSPPTEFIARRRDRGHHPPGSPLYLRIRTLLI